MTPETTQDTVTAYEQFNRHEWRRPALLGGIAAWLVFAGIAFAVAGRNGNLIDETFYEMSPGVSDWNLYRLMRIGRLLGDVRLIGPIAVVLFGVAMYRPHLRRMGLYTFGTFLGGICAGGILKIVLGVPGPPVYGEPQLSGTALPSGHALTATLFWGLLAAVAATYLARRWLPVLVGGWEAAALGVGACQVLMQTHWLSDVVTAWLFGLGWLCLAAVGIWWWEYGRADPGPGEAPGPA
ncbi:MAG: hypothetical protein CSA58_10070 [Micrococcales bacterium]|nr:MAG: hypothetical protein CSB46_03405 [Micrococcales bacterium]PIE26329.1 MAG: hypothetical protein CSA58_10070 [Micrococcales bacterium]